MAQDPRHRPQTAGPAEPALDPSGPRRDTVGRILRRGRERDGLNLRDVAEALRIRYDYLEAIERSEFDRLPGATYAIGFVRSYASYLELDDEEIVRQFKQEVRGLNQTQDLSFPEPVNEGKVPGRALLLVSVLLIGVAYGGWHYLNASGNRGISDMVPAVPDRLQTLLETDEAGVETAADPGDSAGTDHVADEQSGGAGDEPSGLDGSETASAATEESRSDAAATTSTATAEPSSAGGDAAQASDTADAPDDATAKTAEAPANDAGPDSETPSVPESGAADAGEDTASTAGAAESPERDTASTGGGASTPSAPDSGATGTTSAPEVPSSSERAGETQTAAVPEAPSAETESAGEASQSPETASSATSPSTGSAETTTENGIPEPPSPDEPQTGGAAESGAASDSQTASLSQASGSGGDRVVNGAASEVLDNAERVFGAENAQSDVLLRATQDSWVQVRGPDDSPLLTRVLNPGDVYRVPEKDGVILHTGNAGGLQVYIDGDPAGTLGGDGEVKRNIALSPDALR